MSLLRTVFGAILVLVTSQGCLASGGSSYADYVDPMSDSVQFGAMIVLAVLTVATIFLAWREKEKTGSWPHKHVSGMIASLYFTVNLASNVAEHNQYIRLFYNIVVTPVIVGVCAAVSLNVIRKLTEDEIKPWMAVCLIIMSALLVAAGMAFYGEIMSHGSIFKCVMAMIATLTGVLWYRFDDLLSPKFEDHKDGEDSAEDRSDELPSDGRESSPTG